MTLGALIVNVEEALTGKQGRSLVYAIGTRGHGSSTFTGG